ncbi:MAG: hypothetical protein JRH16_02640 [Deltaproteobacteria bacterium]|nr:hypothetical protein [Deltaproteobacteria bacterium]
MRGTDTELDSKLVGTLLLVGFVVLLSPTAGVADAHIPSHEFNGAMRDTNWVRVTAQQLSKQNLLYQLRLGNVTKQDIVDSAGEMDRILDKLANGRTDQWVPKPPTPEIHAAIERIDAKWGPLRTLSMSGPFDMLRRSGLSSRADDPLLVRRFSELSTELGEAAETLLALYLKECLKYEYPLCRVQAINGVPQLLSERMVTALVFVYAGIERETNIVRLREARNTYDATMQRVRKVPLVIEAMDPSRGISGRAISDMLQIADREWHVLRAEVDRILGEEAVRIDFGNVLTSQEQMALQMIRLRVAMERYAATREGLLSPALLRP